MSKGYFRQTLKNFFGPILTHSEGEVLGVGCKIFTIAGPVILYGILSSWALGLIYWVGQAIGML